MFRFIHAADIHLDSPLKGLEQYEGAPVEIIRTAPREALVNLVDLAIDESVAFVLIAGDLYDGDWRDFNTGLFFIRQAQRLRDAGIPLYLISGNHDAANRITRSLQLPENVTFFSPTQAETKLIPELDVAIHGQSFATAAVYDNLAQNYPAAHSGCFNIGVLHTCATGSEGHERYAPCTLEDLKIHNYDYWALGHIHKREILCEDPLIAFSGNIQGRHIRETGPKGCLLVTVDDERRLRTEFRALDILRWERAIVDLDGARSLEEALERVSTTMETLFGQAEGRTLALRIDLQGACPAHNELLARRHQLIAEIRVRALDVGGGEIWIEKIKINTSDPASGNTEISDDALGEIHQVFAQVKANPLLLAELGCDFSKLNQKLPANVRNSALRLNDQAWLNELLTEAESVLMSRLTGRGDQ
ncbi:metallophosphoesterase family protein [Gimesia maris]|uniref:Metallophosphoesterase YhaO n=1 Tax=Gimesia maris TaxID=122 RepID=A0ABX5YP07_9PLAN|nr:DNA repair exonuclease [Gimesia maris]EDL62308.1 putative exonuclease [Gimesia maris DSM 8797]QEG17295.1 putative metallophosphoesterase YhaO [Gimesia maris]QGQ29608.1 DNA repair exonuclease [Gimesia maris]